MQPFNEKKPSSLSSQILRVLAKVSSEGNLHGKALAQAVVNLSRLFTTARPSLPLRYLDDPAHASAYLSYFLPVNLSKIQVLLDELPEGSGMEASDRPMAVLDLGCGIEAQSRRNLCRSWLRMHPTHLCRTRKGCGRPIARRLEYQAQTSVVSRAIWNIRLRETSESRLCGADTTA